jgi:hypothetical protein
MKTRKEAEARAMELFPPHLADNDFHGLTKRDLNEPYRKAFLQCWEEMQANKQACGFCVEPKNEENEQPKDNGLREAADLDMTWTKWCESKSTQEFDEWLRTRLMNSKKH